jgi:hypothetical protein
MQARPPLCWCGKLETQEHKQLHIREARRVDDVEALRLFWLEQYGVVVSRLVAQNLWNEARRGHNERVAD